MRPLVLSLFSGSRCQSVCTGHEYSNRSFDICPRANSQSPTHSIHACRNNVHPWAESGGFLLLSLSVLSLACGVCVSVCGLCSVCVPCVWCARACVVCVACVEACVVLCI